MRQTPVIGRLPRVLAVQERPDPTPIISGFPLRTVAEVLEGAPLGEREIAAAVEVAAVSPESDPTWAAIESDLLSQSCAYFASSVIRGPKKAPYNGRFLLGRHHLEWDDLINRYRRLNILAARDHGKSFFFTHAYPIWKAGYNQPGSTGVIFSATKPQAEAFLAKIKEELLDNPKLAHLLPASRDKRWSSRRIVLRNGSKIIAVGFGTKVRGGHPDWVICDDVLNDNDIYSDTIRRKNVDYFLSAIAGMVHPEDQLIVVGTPMHKKDLYGVLADKEQLLALAGELTEEELAGYIYECRSYPALDPKTGECLFPERYNERALKIKRIELKTAARFGREYLCQPLSDEASLFPVALFSGSDVRLPYSLGLSGDYWHKQGALVYSGVDIAMSAETGADYLVIFTVAVFPDGTRFLANLRREKGLPFSQQIDWIKEEYYLMGSEVINIEANQAQRIWTDEVARTTDIPVRRFFTTGIGGSQPASGWKKGATNVAVNKHHLDRGVPSLRMSLEHKKWRIPRGDARTIQVTDVWIDEMNAIGWIDGKVQTVADHDDTVMACWMCDAAIRQGNPMLDFIETPLEAAPQPVLAAPKIEEQATYGATLFEAEKRVLAALQNGQEAPMPGRDHYLNRVRSAMREYAAAAIELGNYERGRHVLAEIGRLDGFYQFRSYEAQRQNIAQMTERRYRQGTADESQLLIAQPGALGIP